MANIEIVYDKSEKELSAKYYEKGSRIEFDLYQDTDSMVNAGKALRNALACHRGLAVEKVATFMHIKDVYGRIIGCVSLKKQNSRFVVWEIEIIDSISPVCKEVTIKWMKEHQIDCSGEFQFKNYNGKVYAKQILATA